MKAERREIALAKTRLGDDMMLTDKYADYVRWCDFAGIPTKARLTIDEYERAMIKGDDE